MNDEGNNSFTGRYNSTPSTMGSIYSPRNATIGSDNLNKPEEKPRPQQQVMKKAQGGI